MAEVDSPSDAVLRVTRFGGGMSRHPVDAAAREALPRLLAEAGNVGAWFGRRLTENGEERAIVTIWRSAADEAASRRLLDIIGPDAIATGMVDRSDRVGPLRQRVVALRPDHPAVGPDAGPNRLAPARRDQDAHMQPAAGEVAGVVTQGSTPGFSRGSHVSRFPRLRRA